MMGWRIILSNCREILNCHQLELLFYIVLKLFLISQSSTPSAFIPASSSEHRDLIAALTFQTGG